MFSSPSPAERPRPRETPASSPTGKGVPYLFSHRNAPAFRIRIPADLQPCLGKTEYRRSLGRCYAAEAKLRALRLATAALEVFAFARGVIQSRQVVNGSQGRLGSTKEPTTFRAGSTPRHVNREKHQVQQDNYPPPSGSTPPPPTTDLQGRPLSSLTDDEIRSIAETWLLNALKDTNLFLMQAAPIRDRMTVDGRRKATPEEVQEVLVSLGAVEEEPTSTAGGKAREATATTATPPPLDASLEEQAQADSTTAGNIKVIHRKALASNRVTGIAHEADKQITAHGITAEPGTESAAAVASGSRPSVPYLKTCQELLKAKATYYGIMEQNHQGDYAAYDAEVQRLEEKQEARRRTKRRVKVDEATAPPPPSLVQPCPRQTHRRRSGSRMP